jgi:RNA polymerase sigma-70 factor, ECF subfamily
VTGDGPCVGMAASGMHWPDRAIAMDVNQNADTRRMDEFAALLGRHQRQLYLYILSLMPRPVDAEDVLQDTNVILWNKFDQYQPGTPFATWACQIARFKVLQHLQSSQRRPVLMDADLLSQLAEDTQEMSDELEVEQQRLEKCLEQLAADDRLLILRRYAAGETGKSVAEHLGRPANSVYKSIARIRRQLLKCIRHARAMDPIPGEEP